MLVDVDPSAVVARRLTDTRRRALAQDRGDARRGRDDPRRRPARAATSTLAPPLTPFCDDLEQMRLALELGLSDYVRKNGFEEIVVGVSGGIDSALVAALAAEALGAERVHCVSMPSRYSSEGTRGDAQQLAENLGCDFREIAIEPIVERVHRRARAQSSRTSSPTSPRRTCRRALRGVLLMALSNKFGWLLVATGNKSEMSVGYATLYGDMAGGFALLKDVYKTDVFRLARHLNERAGRELIPQSIIDRRAERRAARRPARRGLAAAVPAARPGARGVRRGRPHARGALGRRLRPRRRRARRGAVDRAEYKRRQAPPGVRLRPKAFGRDRRTPITNRWRS